MPSILNRPVLARQLVHATISRSSSHDQQPRPPRTVLRDDDLSLELIRLSDYDDGVDVVEALSHAHWPEFLFHTTAIERHWSVLLERFPECQLVIRDLPTGTLVGTANSIPFALGSSNLAARQDGWDGVLRAGTAPDAPPPDTLSALSVLIVPAHRRPGAALLALRGMKQIAREHGFRELVAPVRPTLKHSYPLASFDRYVRWQRSDGEAFDPWIRKHMNLGGAVVGPAWQSMRVEASIADWERWTGMSLPESGSYIIPHALVPVEVDRDTDRALYVEPNLWIRHRVR
jgi:Acetyltransferase (GNAT) family